MSKLPKTGKVCAKHPELRGLRNNSNTCTECARESTAAYRKRNPDKCLEQRRLSDAKKKAASPMYECWKGIRKRCYSPTSRQYNRYGGRGIRVCAEWDDFAAFERWALSTGYQVGLQIDRIDNDGHYEPNNCRWVTCAENNRNRSSTKLTETDVGAIKSLLKLRVRHRAAAELFAVSKDLIEDISRGRRWKDVPAAIAY